MSGPTNFIELLRLCIPDHSVNAAELQVQPTRRLFPKLYWWQKFPVGLELWLLQCRSSHITAESSSCRENRRH